MATTLRCYHLAALLQPGDDHAAARQQIAAALQALAPSMNEGTPFSFSAPAIDDRGANTLILQEMADVLAKLACGETIDLPQGEAEKSPLLPDAWRNPAYLHFALKTLLATLLCYVFYTAADCKGSTPSC